MLRYLTIKHYKRRKMLNNVLPLHFFTTFVLNVILKHYICSRI